MPACDIKNVLSNILKKYYIAKKNLLEKEKYFKTVKNVLRNSNK
jgi:hypothetical protein